MPKIKTNRLAKKKFRFTSKGKLKRAQAFTSHNTAKQTPKRRRQLRHPVVVDKTNERALKRMLPYG